MSHLEHSSHSVDKDSMKLNLTTVRLPLTSLVPYKWLLESGA
jgi:hypothetical protein